MTILTLLHRYVLSLNKVRFFPLVILFIIFSSFQICFSQVVPNNEKYLQERMLNESVNIIYSPRYKSIIPKVKEKISFLSQRFEKDFNWKLDDEVSFILASPSNQISNGYATPYPYLKTTFYPGGLILQDSFAIKSWLDTLLIHEFVHLYQTSIKKTPSKINKAIFNNNPFPVFPLFAWTFPNSYLPTWILEGNAVYNESRFFNGGRLYSGEGLALFNGLIKDNKVSANWLINHHLDFPFGREKYIVGGYFSWFLSKYLGSKKVNKLFDTHSSNFWNPFVVNRTFKLHYRKDYYRLILDFIKDSKRKAQDFKVSKNPTLIKSVIAPQFTLKEERVVFLMSKDKKSPLTLIDYNIKNSNIKKSQTTLKGGKLFINEKGEFFSAHASLYKKNNYYFALWDENQNIYPNSINKIITDKYKNEFLYFKGENSFQEPVIFSNEKRVGICHSKGIFDIKKNVYCFHQKNEKRSLLKNGSSLFSYDGYYGKLVNVDDSGVTFIGSSKYGSTLYKFTNHKKFKRIHSSDAIVEAVQISKEEYLIAEVKSNGYHVKRVKSDINNELSPHFEEVGPKYRSFQIFTRDIDKEEKKSLPKKYNPLTSIRYSSLQIQTATNLLLLNANWVDPLDFYTLNLFYQVEDIDPTYKIPQHTFKSTLESKKDLLNWSLEVLIKKVEDNKSVSQTTFKDKQTLTLETSYPLIRDDLNNLFLINLLESDFSSKSKTLGLGLSYVKIRSFPLSYFPFYRIKGKMFFKKDLKSQGSFLNINSYFSKDLGGENFISSEIDFSKTSLNEISLSGLQSLIPFPNLSITQSENKLSFLRFSLETKKVINSSFYFKIFPISMRRSALSLIYHNFFITDSKKSEPIILGANYNIESLLLHSNIIRFNLSFFRN